MNLTIIWGVFMIFLGIISSPPGGEAAEVVKLPPPAFEGVMSVEEALKRRRTVRRFASRGLELKQVSQLLWARGLKRPRGLRTAASAGATYPMELYLVVGERGVAQLAPGLYHYRPAEPGLELLQKGDLRAAAARASLSQGWMAEAPVMVVIAAEYRRCQAACMATGASDTPTWSPGMWPRISSSRPKPWDWPRGSWGPLMMGV